MPDIDYSIATKGQTPDSFKTIGNLLDFANKAQALKTSKQEYERGGVALEKERALLQPGIEKGRAESESAQTASQHAKFKLQGEQAGVMLNEAAALQQHPAILNGDPEGTVKALMEAKQRAIDKGVPPEKAEWQTSLLTSKAHQPGEVLKALQTITRANSGPAAQAEVLNSPLTPVPTGSTTQFAQTRPGAPGAAQTGPGGAIQNTLPPAQRQEASINPVTQSPMVTEKDPQGRVVDVRQAPTAGGIPQLAPGQPQDIPILTNIRSGVNTAAAKVPEHHFNNQQIIKLADETNTGKGAQLVANLRGQYAGIPWTSDSAKNFNSLGHFLALETQTNAQAMGLSTDAARELSGQAVASTGWTKDAIKTAAKVNDALATGLDYFNRGMEKAVAANGGNVLAVRPFQNAWSKAFDPNVYRYANALESGDKAEITKILGPEGSPQRKAKALELSQKSATLYRLSNEGQ